MGWFRQFLIRLVSTLWEITIIVALTMCYFMETFVVTFTPSFLRTQKSLKGKVIVITGGAGGLGQEVVLRLARLKAQVVVWDINLKAIAETQQRLKKEGYEVHTYVVDVTDRHSVYKNADLVKSEVGPVDIIINNAGVVVGHTLLDIPDQLLEKTFQVNIISHYWTIKAFLGNMLKRGKGHIVTVSSLTGLLGAYKCADYSATKYGLSGLHESLNFELKAHGHDNIRTTIICPYFINTEMFSGCKPRSMAMLEPKDVAKRLITAIRREEDFVTMPAMARFIFPIKYYLPSKVNWLIGIRAMRLHQSMMGLKGKIQLYNKSEDVAAA